MVTPSSANPEIGSALAAGALRRTNYRWVVAVLLCGMFLLLFMDRSNISIAAPLIMKEFGLSKIKMGLVFSAFAWTYSLAGPLGGWLGDKFGPRKVLSLMVLFWSVMTAMTAHAVGFVSLLVIRAVFGLAEAGAAPTATRAMQHWYPKSERGFINGLTHSCNIFATSLVPLTGVAIISAFGWRALFYAFGGIGIVWTVFYYFMYRDRPEQHRGVNAAELTHIRDVGAQASADAATGIQRNEVVPWGKILTSANMWYLALAYIAYQYVAYFFYFWMPTYLIEHLHISFKAMGILASVPMGAGAVGALSGGVVTDIIYRHTRNLKWSRRAVCIAALAGSALFMIPAGTVSSPALVLIFLSCGYFCATLVLAPAWAVSIDISGGYSGTVSGLMNMMGNAGGAVSPVVFGALTQKGFLVAPFVITSAVLVIAALMWAFLINPERSVVES